MKRLWLLAIVTLSAISAWCQGEFTTLVVEMNDGSSVNYILKQKPQISLGEEVVCITTHDDGLQTTYPVSEVKNFRFQAFGPVKIEEAVVSPKMMTVKYLDGQNVSICGTESSDRIVLYSIGGQLVRNNVITEDGETTIHIDSLEKGVYIIKVSDKQTFKILKR